MKNQFDLYKWIIIGSLGVMPIAGGWLYWLEQRIAEGERAVASAKHPRTGELQRIGRLMQEIEIQAKSAGTVTTGEPDVYFEVKINESSKGGLKRADIQPSRVSATPHRETKSVEKVYKIDFKKEGKTQYALSRELVEAILFNIEKNTPPGWRLRALSLRNEDTGAKQLRTSGKQPPPEIKDEWFVDKMEFARREPEKK